MENTSSSRRRGRPSKYRPEVTGRICAALRAGRTRQAACAHGGISDETFARWQAHYVDFVEAVACAETEAQMQAVSCLRLAMPQNWRAAAWYLSRRYPAEWGQQQMRGVNGGSVSECGGGGSGQPFRLVWQDAEADHEPPEKR